MDMQRLLILRGLPEALKAFRSDKDFEGRLVEALRTHLSAGPRDSLYYQDRGTEDGQAFVIYLFNRADPSSSGICQVYPGDECLYRVPYAVTPGGALEFSFGAPEKVRERRDYVPEGEIAKAGPVANRPGLALDPTSHRWKKTEIGARPGLTLNKESREIVHHDEAPNDAAAAAYEHQQAAAGHAEKVAEWVKKSREWPRREDGSPVNATAYKKNQRHSDKHGEAWAAHHNAMTGHLHGSAAPGESDHAREKSKHANEWSAANGFGPAEALKAGPVANRPGMTLDPMVHRWKRSEALATQHRAGGNAATASLFESHARALRSGDHLSAKKAEDAIASADHKPSDKYLFDKVRAAGGDVEEAGRQVKRDVPDLAHAHTGARLRGMAERAHQAIAEQHRQAASSIGDEWDRMPHEHAADAHEAAAAKWATGAKDAAASGRVAREYSHAASSAEALKAKAKGDNLTLDMFGGGALAAAAKPAAAPAKPASAAPRVALTHEQQSHFDKADSHDAQAKQYRKQGDHDTADLHAKAATKWRAVAAGSEMISKADAHAASAAAAQGASAKPAPAGDDETHATVRKAQELMEVGHPSPFGQSWAAHSKATIDAAHRQAFPEKYGAGDPTHGGRLVAQKVTDKAGHQTTRYKKTGEADRHDAMRLDHETTAGKHFTTAAFAEDRGERRVFRSHEAAHRAHLDAAKAHEQANALHRDGAPGADAASKLADALTSKAKRATADATLTDRANRDQKGEAAHPLAHLQKMQPGDQTTVNGVRLHVSTPIGHGTVPHIHDTEAGRELGPRDDPKTLDKVAEHVQKPRDTIPGTPESIRKMTSAMGPKVTMPNGETVQRVSVSNPGEAHSRAMSEHRERGDQHRQAAIAAEDRGDQAAADAHYAAWDAHDAAASAHGTAAQHATTSTDEAAVSRSRASSSAAAQQAAKAESASAAAAALDKGGTASAPPKPPATTPASPPAPASPSPSQDPDGFEALHPKSKEVFNAAFSSKDPSALSSMLHADNKRLRAEFSRRTGVKLPPTVKGTREAIHQWAATAAADTPVKVKDAQAGVEHKIPPATDGPPPALSLAEGHAAAAKQHQDKADWHNQAAKAPGAATKHETARGLHQAAADWHTAASKAPQGSPEYERAAKLARQSEHEAREASYRAPAPSSGPDKVTLNRYGVKTEHEVKHSAGRYHVIPYPPTPSTNGRTKHYPGHYTVVEAGENGEADTSSIAGHLTQDEAASLAADHHGKAPGGYASLRGNLQALTEHVTRAQLAKDRSAKHLAKPVIK